MPIDLAALEDPTLAGYVQSIPLNVDPFPYADLQAQGRYPIQSTPDTIPQMLAYLAGVDAENGQGGRVGYIDDQHRLLVHDPSSGGGGLSTPLLTTPDQGQTTTLGSGDDRFLCNGPPAGQRIYSFSATAFLPPGSGIVTNQYGYITFYIPTSDGVGRLDLACLAVMNQASAGQQAFWLAQTTQTVPGGLAPANPTLSGNAMEIHFRQDVFGPSLVISFNYACG